MPETKDRDRRTMIAQFKGTVAFRDWANRLAEHCRAPVTQILDIALVAYARSVGFGEPAPKRGTIHPSGTGGKKSEKIPE